MDSLIAPVMTAEEAQDWKARISATANQLRLLLFEGYERQAWEALGYATWTDCLKALAEECRFSERRLWQLHAANEIEQNLTEPGSVGQLPERALRPLTSLEPDEQRAVWQEAVSTAPTGKPTAAHVQKTVTRAKGQPSAPQVNTPQTAVPEPRKPPRMLVQDEMILSLKNIGDKDSWEVLAQLWSALEFHYLHHPDYSELRRENSLATLKVLLPHFPPALVEEYELGQPYPPSKQQSLGLTSEAVASEDEIDPLDINDAPDPDTPHTADGEECTACGEWEHAGPTVRADCCGDYIHEDCRTYHEAWHRSQAKAEAKANVAK